ncbi:hypothetical protein Dfri01_59260 [Dyadobacter frigoris]|nr:hypothetical protein Dfri01_59260 [Dyadobacter frigoris]
MKNIRIIIVLLISISSFLFFSQYAAGIRALVVSLLLGGLSYAVTAIFKTELEQGDKKTSWFIIGVFVLILIVGFMTNTDMSRSTYTPVFHLTH